MKPLLITDLDETTARYAIVEGLYFEIRDPDLHYNITYEQKHLAYVLTCAITCQPHWKDIIYQLVLRERCILFSLHHGNWGGPTSGSVTMYDYDDPQSVSDLVKAAKAAHACRELMPLERLAKAVVEA